MIIVLDASGAAEIIDLKSVRNRRLPICSFIASSSALTDSAVLSGIFLAISTFALRSVSVSKHAGEPFLPL